MKFIRLKQNFLRFFEKDRVAKIKPEEDFLEVAQKIKVKKKIDPSKTRELMEKIYERE